MSRETRSEREIRYAEQEIRRHDPARRAAVVAQDERVREVYARAKELLDQAADVVWSLSRADRESDPMASRGFDAITIAQVSIGGDARTVLNPANETAIGNRAARGLPVGWTPKSDD